MSKMNAVRLINLNYNNNAIRISDESFHLNGASTLMSLRNGGGKSVLVQMMMAPFVHKRYRDAKDRPFESYFTTNKPSFIMVEWCLDQGAGYVLTGMMVRRSQDMEGENGENLEMVNFICEYQAPCLQDIHHLPVVEKGKKEIILKNFASCRQMFEAYKRDRSMKFFYFDMSNSAQSRQYFEKLKEYQIHYKEWETIIKKVNLKESGLSELFSDCRDEKGLVEKWFLEAVESKLNKEKNLMKEFQTIVEKYVGQYKDNRSKIQRRDNIRSFKEETGHIEEKAVIYQDSDRKEREQENRIAHFIAELNSLRTQAQEEHQRALDGLGGLRQAIARVEYEKLSGEIHTLKDELLYHTSNRDMIEAEQDELEREAVKLEGELHLYACAKGQGQVEQEAGELETIRQKLAVSRKKDEDLEPERKSLGAKLKHHYNQALEMNKEEGTKNEHLHNQVSEEIQQEKLKINDLEKEIRDKIASEGSLRTQVDSYGQQEERYNSLYKEELVRSILGTYEPGALEIRRETYRKELEETTRERSAKKQQFENTQKEQKSLQRLLEDLRGEQIHKKLELEQEEKRKGDYAKELEVRKIILKYLDLDETALFDIEKIVQTSQRKLSGLAGLRRNLEKEEDALQKEYQRLTQGKVLELPQEMEEALKNMGIHAVYGMEWLSKNGDTSARNQELVKSHPFLPYALILSELDLKKLSQNAGELYTSFPIPIIVREHLEQESAKDMGGIIRFQGVSFYVLFNENLLDEEKLSQLVREKEEQLRKKKEAIAIRQTEYQEYFERQETVRNQAVTKQGFEENRELMEALGQQLEKLDEEGRRMSGELAEQKELLQGLDTEIRTADRQILWQSRRSEDYQLLCKAYEAYEENRAKLERCRKEVARLQEQQKLSRVQEEKLQERQRTLETQRDRLEIKGQQLSDSYQKYQAYEAAEVSGEVLEVTVMEARYAAITSNLSLELQSLEEQEQKAARRYQEALDELTHLQKKYSLKSGAWLEIQYSRKEESHHEVLLEDRRIKLELKKALWNEEDKHIAVIAQQITDRLKRMQSECGEKEPLPKGEIQDQDYDARRNRLRYEEKEQLKKADGIQAQLRSYDENLTALAEYNEFKLNGEAEWEQDFSELDSKELRSFKGILIRDYNQKLRDRQDAKDRLVQVLNRVVRMERFQEDFYRKPLESMIELSGDAGQVLKQISTTLQSYDSLMEKLEVDISMVEREKKKIVELMEEYVREVHLNLDKIDHSSTITIRERPVKMLKIQLPDWEENESLYQMRLQDLIDEITQKGIGMFERNENAQEYFGIQITTKNLYDRVIGVGNIQIRLYKIEAQREYPITWAEVARNSGGEGFLSAFVILSSLLYYMRKDDTDIFADKNEGKVLLMDNPFAQTNAAHLLKPLMDMANKTNTQLICLTGLGGESIYNRFDNIYVLNLIAASLRNGMQYLRADHLRGNEPETMVVSQIEVMEQQEFVF